MDFQTPPEVCNYMVDHIPGWITINCTILEPTPGQGNIVNSLKEYGFKNIITPENFWDLPDERISGLRKS